jgi:putative SOS response-associated peptidase YedK
MCGRFITPDQAAIERHWGLVAPAIFTQSFNMAPSQLAPVIRVNENDGQELALLTWGFQPSWAKRAWINARSETIFESKAFASAARKRRCIVPAVGWYEWQGKTPPRQPYVFHRDGFLPFGFAGIWTAREVDEQWQRSFAIVTAAASGELAEIHHRRPVVLSTEAQLEWLSADLDAATAMNLFQQEPHLIKTYRVSGYVNKPVNNDPNCIAPLDA